MKEKTYSIRGACRTPEGMVYKAHGGIRETFVLTFVDALMIKGYDEQIIIKKEEKEVPK